jgi:hypothetical protein
MYVVRVQFRGAVFFLVAIVTIFLFDHDDETHSNESSIFLDVIEMYIYKF